MLFNNLTEDEKNRILEMHNAYKTRNILNEQSSPIIINDFDKIYDYKKEGQNYYWKRKNKGDWKLASGKAKEAIASKVFNSKATNTPTKTPTKVVPKTKQQPKNNVVPEVVKNAPRINAEVQFINQRPQYNNKPFFICDPKHNLVLAFNEKHQLIDYSQSIAGADKQKAIVYTYKQWCKDSGLAYNDRTGLCANQKDFKLADTSDKKLKIKAVAPTYQAISATYNRYAAKGIYQTSSISYNPEYSGKQGAPNVIRLKTSDNKLVPTAIHGLVPEKNRIVADNQLKKYLNKEKSFGRIPDEYYDIIEKMTTEDLSSGCFNVDPKFINNPEVIRISKKNAPVFIMGETNTDYLVQVDPGKTVDFFKEFAGGDDSGVCHTPNYFINTYGTNAGEKMMA